MYAFQADGHHCLHLRREETTVNYVVCRIERVIRLNLAIGFYCNRILVPQAQTVWRLEWGLH